MIAPVIGTTSTGHGRVGSPSAIVKGRIVAAIIGPSDESGPSTRIREAPKIA